MLRNWHLSAGSLTLKSGKLRHKSHLKSGGGGGQPGPSTLFLLRACCAPSLGSQQRAQQTNAPPPYPPHRPFPVQGGYDISRLTSLRTWRKWGGGGGRKLAGVLPTQEAASGHSPAEKARARSGDCQVPRLRPRPEVGVFPSATGQPWSVCMLRGCF